MFKITPAGEDYLKAMKLSKREREVVNELVSQTVTSNKDVARRMFIGEKSVRGHLTNVYKKLGVDGSLCGKKTGVVLKLTPYMIAIPVEIK